MNPLHALTLVFLMMGGYGLGTNKLLPTVMSFGMVGLMFYAGRVFKRQDAEHEKFVRIRQSLLLTSEHMLELHGCEAGAPCIYNPSVGMQVAD